MHLLLKSTLLFVLLYVQYGALVHAVEHPFHEEHAENNCDVYLAGERLADASFQHTSDLLEHISFNSDYQTSFWVSIPSQTIRPRSRAPPFSVFS